jgi:hypothetical protein
MNKHLLVLFVSLFVCFGVQDSLLAQSNSQVGITPSEIPLDELKVYPNPTTDYFQISNGLNVKKVIIYNMFGKEVKSFFHYNNAQHDVNDLKAGMYIVKMMDDRNKVVKSIKLHKNFAGV